MYATARWRRKGIPLTGLELDEVHDLAGGDVELHRVVDLDQRVRVAQRAPVVRHQERHVLRAHRHPSHLAQLVLRGEPPFTFNNTI